jgi:hypothetical protein
LVAFTIGVRVEAVEGASYGVGVVPRDVLANGVGEQTTSRKLEASCQLVHLVEEFIGHRDGR